MTRRRTLTRISLAAVFVAAAMVPAGCGPRLSPHERAAADVLTEAKGHLAYASTPAEERQIVLDLLHAAGLYSETAQGKEAYALAEKTFLGMIHPGSGLTVFADEVVEPPSSSSGVDIDPLRDYAGFRKIAPEPFKGSALATASREALLDYADHVARELVGIGTDRIAWASLMRHDGSAGNFDALTDSQLEDLVYVGQLLPDLGQSASMKTAWAKLIAVGKLATTGLSSAGTEIRGDTMTTRWTPGQIRAVEANGTALKAKAMQIQAVFARMRAQTKPSGS